MSQVSRTHIEQSALPCWWPPREPDSLSDLSVVCPISCHYWGSSGLGIPNGTWHRKPKHTAYPRLAIWLHPATLHLMIHPRNTAEAVWKQAAHRRLNQTAKPRQHVCTSSVLVWCKTHRNDEGGGKDHLDAINRIWLQANLPSSEIIPTIGLRWTPGFVKKSASRPLTGRSLPLKCDPLVIQLVKGSNTYTLTTTSCQSTSTVTLQTPQPH